jgi:hypothetical protein
MPSKVSANPDELRHDRMQAGYVNIRFIHAIQRVRLRVCLPDDLDNASRRGPCVLRRRGAELGAQAMRVEQAIQRDARYPELLRSIAKTATMTQ